MDTKKFNKLIKNFKTDSYAYNELARFYHSKIIFYIQRNYRGYGLGEDIAQEFFAKLPKIKIPDYIEFPATWIYRICDNIAKDFITSENEYNLSFTKEESTQKDDLLNKIIFGETYEKLKRLEPQIKEIIVMNIWEGYNLKEIAIIKSLNYNTVRQNFSRGIKKLKKM